MDSWGIRPSHDKYRVLGATRATLTTKDVTLTYYRQGWSVLILQLEIFGSKGTSEMRTLTGAVGQYHAPLWAKLIPGLK